MTVLRQVVFGGRSNPYASSANDGDVVVKDEFRWKDCKC